MWRRTNVEYEGDLNQKVEIPQFEEVEHSNRKIWIVSVAAIVIIALAVTVMVFFTGGSSGITVYDGEVRLTGANGFSVPLAELDCTLVEEDLPPIEGYAGTGTLQGTYRFSDGEECFFAIETLKGPVVLLEYGGKSYYINYETDQETRDLYEQIVAGMEAEKEQAAQ